LHGEDFQLLAQAHGCRQRAAKTAALMGTPHQRLHSHTETAQELFTAGSSIQFAWQQLSAAPHSQQQERAALPRTAHQRLHRATAKGTARTIHCWLEHTGASAAGMHSCGRRAAGRGSSPVHHPSAPAQQQQNRTAQGLFTDGASI
jgi:hypothetical protein